MTLSSVEKSFCTTTEAAGLLGVSVGTVQQWTECGLLSAWKTAGGHRRVMRESVERLIRHTPETPRATASIEQGRRKYMRRNGGLPPRRLHILVVHENPETLRWCEVQLSAWESQPRVVTLSDPFAALILLGRWTPDVLVLGAEFSCLNSLAMLNALTQTPQASHTKLVALTRRLADATSLPLEFPPHVEVIDESNAMNRLHSLALELEQQLLLQTPSTAPMAANPR